jgi:predicted RNA binding protein YcfA (HicA-like mRNA interferase family)
LPGCISQGSARSEALANIREAMALYIEDCRDAGDSAPTEAGKEFVEVEAAQVAALPTDLSGRQVGGALERVGFAFRRQRVSHMILRREDPYARVVVPNHARNRRATQRRIISDAGLAVG